MLSMRYVSRLPGAGNVKCCAGTAGTVAGLGGSARADAAAYGEIGTAENAFNFLAGAFVAFQFCRILGAGKEDLKIFIAFQTFKFINRHIESPKSFFLWG